MRKPDVVAITALALLSLTVVLPSYGASRLVIAQADTKAAPTAAAPAQPPATANAPPTTVAPAEKSALSIPACSVRYLEAKVTGKLQGRKWVDFRRDECGRHEVSAVFPTAISPK